MPTPQSSATNTMDKLCSATWQAFIRTQTCKPGEQKLNNGEVTLNGITATGSESIISGQTLVWNRPPWIEPDSPQHFEVLFDDAHLLAVNKTHRTAHSARRRLHGKHPPAPGAKANPQRKSCPPVGPSHHRDRPFSPKHHRRPLIYSQIGTHLKFKRSTARWLKISHSTTPTKSSHLLAWFRTRSSVIGKCGPRAQLAKRQSHWQR